MAARVGAKDATIANLLTIDGLHPHGGLMPCLLRMIGKISDRMADIFLLPVLCLVAVPVSVSCGRRLYAVQYTRHIGQSVLLIYGVDEVGHIL